jgi:hypothetical protein
MEEPCLSSKKSLIWKSFCRSSWQSQNGLLILKCSHYFLDVGIKFVVNLRL